MLLFRLPHSSECGTTEATSSTALRQTPVYQGVGFPWLPLIESKEEPNGLGESQGHCERAPQISWAAHSSISLLPSQLRTLLKDMRDRLLTLPTQSASRVTLWAKITLIWAKGQICPHCRRARCTRSCRCRSASSAFTDGGASPRRVLGGASGKALTTKFWCSQELSDLPNGGGGIIARSAV